MDIYMHKTMARVGSLEKIEIIRSQEFMPSEARLQFLKKMIILGPKTAILGPQFCRILVLGPHFWWSGSLGPLLDPPLGRSRISCWGWGAPTSNTGAFGRKCMRKQKIGSRWGGGEALAAPGSANARSYP